MNLRNKAHPFILLFLILLPIILPALSFAADQTRNVFGPESFVRTRGATTVHNRTFNVPPHVSSPFSLQIVNGNPDGTKRRAITNAVSSGRVLIDGLEVVSPNDFSKTVAVIDKPLTLVPGNHTLEIRLNSAPNSFFTLTISGVIPLGDLGQARSDHTATLLPDGGVLMTGGKNATGPLATAERLDLGTLLFSPLAGGLDICISFFPFWIVSNHRSVLGLEPILAGYTLYCYG